VGGLGTITVSIFSLVIVGLHRITKIGFGILDAFRNLRQIGQFEWCAVSFDDLHQIDSVEKELIVLDMELFSGEIKRLLDQVNVSVHLPGVYLHDIWLQKLRFYRRISRKKGTNPVGLVPFPLKLILS
jgi:hypothetical protein